MLTQPTPIATQSSVGLGNVDNTSDLNKPVSNATQTALNLKQNLLPYTSYQALLTQSSTDAPVAVVYGNGFGATTFTLARTSAGLYTITASTPVFTANKTTISFSNPLATLVSIFAVITSTTVITFTTGLLAAGVAVPTDALLTNTLAEIKVFS